MPTSFELGNASSVHAAVKPVLTTVALVGAILAPGPARAQSTGAAPQDAPAPIVLAANEDVEVRLSARVHRMLQVVDDGRETDVFHTDSLQGPTILRVEASTRDSGAVTVGAALEMGLQANSPLFVNQENPDAGMSVSGRVAELFVDTSAGRFGAGRGFAASWVTAETDLSGTQFASLLAIGNLFPGLRFVAADTNRLTDITLSTHFADLERLLIKDRVRYDSPRLGGLQGSGSVANDGRWDLALRTDHTAGDFRVRGAATYQHKPFRDLDRRWDFIVTTRHEPTGLNLTGDIFHQRTESGRSARGFIVKGGWLAQLFSIGTTAFSGDYARGSDFVVTDDLSRSVGVVAVQSWTKYGVSFYAGVRWFDINRSDVRTKPIVVFPIGGVFSF